MANMWWEVCIKLTNGCPYQKGIKKQILGSGLAQKLSLKYFQCYQQAYQGLN